MPLQIGERVALKSVGGLSATVTKQLGEGGFSYVFLAEYYNPAAGLTSSDASVANSTISGSSIAASSTRSIRGSNNENEAYYEEVALKVTAVRSREMRDTTAKEVALLRRLNHPNIVQVVDVQYLLNHSSTLKGASTIGSTTSSKTVPLHVLAMDYCNGGTALDVVHRLGQAKQRFHWQQLIIVFGQIANAVTYLHAQKPPIVHRDLKLENFLVHHTQAAGSKAKITTYKLCDFGSATIGHIDVSTPKDRTAASEIIETTTSKLYRAPEMVDLYMKDTLTEKTDVWSLGCCLYSLAFCKDCFDDKSNLAIIAGKYKIPEDNQYGDEFVELIDRMLTLDADYRADMPEVICCLSALYSKFPLPPRKEEITKSRLKDTAPKIDARGGAFRTDGQGVVPNYETDSRPNISSKVKILDPNSAAARRRKKKLAEMKKKDDSIESNFDANFKDDFGFESDFQSTAFSGFQDGSHPLDEASSEIDSEMNKAFDAFQTITVKDEADFQQYFVSENAFEEISPPLQEGEPDDTHLLQESVSVSDDHPAAGAVII